MWELHRVYTQTFVEVSWKAENLSLGRSKSSVRALASEGTCRESRAGKDWEECCVTGSHWVRLGLSGRGSLSQSIPVTPNPQCSSLSDSSANPSCKPCVSGTIPNMRLLWACSRRRNGRKEQHLLRSYSSTLPLCFAGGKECEPTSELPILTRKNLLLPSKKSLWNLSNYIQYMGHSQINV